MASSASTIVVALGVDVCISCCAREESFSGLRSDAFLLLENGRTSVPEDAVDLCYVIARSYGGSATLPRPIKEVAPP
jgi:hypothetical protein